MFVDGRLPPTLKKDAHDVILDFIRSRPPLKPVKIYSRKKYLFWKTQIMNYDCDFYFESIVYAFVLLVYEIEIR